MFFVSILTLFVMTLSFSPSWNLWFPFGCQECILKNIHVLCCSSWKTCRKIEHKCQSYRDSICSSSCIICWSSEEETKRAWRVSQLTFCFFPLLAYHFFFSSSTLSVIFSPLILPLIFMQNPRNKPCMPRMKYSLLDRKKAWMILRLWLSRVLWSLLSLSLKWCTFSPSLYSLSVPSFSFMSRREA